MKRLGSKAGIVLLGLIFLAIWSGMGLAAGSDIERVSIAQLKGLVEKGTDIVIVDNRPKADFDRQRIKGSVSLPWAIDVTADAKKLLPKGKTIITYCDCGPGESDSADVAAQLMDAGFTDVKTLADGWAAWVTAGGPVEKGTRK